MVQTARTRGADIHARALSDRLKTLQHLNFIGAVFLLNLGDFYSVFSRFDTLGFFKLFHILQNTNLRYSFIPVPN